MRPQQKFASVEELRAQMARDVAAVRERHQCRSPRRPQR
ncbi:MAG: riboflavin kinase [Phycisphaerae bacterium]